jgi:sulfate/thiosulfate transport system ATP-binding protein
MSIALRGVTKRFDRHVALKDVTVEIESGSLTALVGPSGGGKSTLLRVIAGLERPDSGDVLIDGQMAVDVPVQDRGIGFVFQHYAAFKHMTVWENVAFGLRVRKMQSYAIRERVDHLLHLVQLEGLGSRYPSQLSGGQRQRMALARALAIKPEVLLLDEPFGALDAAVRAELRAWLRALHRDVHVTTIFVTHDQGEAMEIADRIILINRGNVEQTGTPRDLYERPANPFVMSFIGPITQLGDAFVRPHDIDVRCVPAESSLEAMVQRIVHLGFEVRVDLMLADGRGVWAQLTRDEVDQLELRLGQIVYVRSSRETRFHPDVPSHAMLGNAG